MTHMKSHSAIRGRLCDERRRGNNKAPASNSPTKEHRIFRMRAVARRQKAKPLATSNPRGRATTMKRRWLNGNVLAASTYTAETVVTVNTTRADSLLQYQIRYYKSTFFTRRGGGRGARSRSSRPRARPHVVLRPEKHHMEAQRQRRRRWR